MLSSSVRPIAAKARFAAGCGGAVRTAACGIHAAHVRASSAANASNGNRGFHTKRSPLLAPVHVDLERVDMGSDLSGFIIGEPNAPAVVVLQEWWGITEEIKKQAAHISASTGFRCLVPDLYKGKIGVDAEEAAHLMDNLDFPRAVEEITAAVKWLKSTGSPEVAATGFCMGGALALCAAQHSGVCAAAPFYGIPDRAICQPEKIKVPLQLHFGELDDTKGFSDPDSARALAQSLSDNGVEYELYIYTGVGHAFMNEHADNPEITLGKTAATGYPRTVEAQRELAWSRLFEFLHKAVAIGDRARRE